VEDGCTSVNMDINLIERLLLEKGVGATLPLHEPTEYMAMDTIVQLLQPSPQSGRPMGCGDFRSR
jgi:hypothetical protein